MKLVEIYTDGACSGNPGPGGYGAILKSNGNTKELSQGFKNTTNNRMELTAAIEALRALKRPCQVEFYTDSEYVRRGITEQIGKWQDQNWQRKGKPIPNVDLWQQLLALTEVHDINWHWVRGHSGNKLNERVDVLARDARLAITPAVELSREARRLYVRGTCKGNPGPGAWAVILESGEESRQLSGTEPSTTNNRMELMAVIGGLSLIPTGESAYVVTTSDYVFMGATRWIHGWRRRSWKKKDGQPVSNQDLWQELDQMLRERAVELISGKGDLEQFKVGLDETALLARRAMEMER